MGIHDEFRTIGTLSGPGGAYVYDVNYEIK